MNRYLDLDALQAAPTEAERAFRSRETAWQALVEVRLLHREEEGGGAAVGCGWIGCNIARVVDRYPALQKWEEEQVARLRRGQTHALPDAHPTVLDRRRDSPTVGRCPQIEP